MPRKVEYMIPKETLYRLYVIEEKSLNDIAENLGCGWKKVYNDLKRYGIPLRSPQEGKRLYDKNNVNVDFFRKLTPELAYILGLWITDGSVGDKNEISIALIDKDVIEWIANTINYRNKITEFADQDINHNKRYYIRFTNEDVANIFKSYGVSERKTLTVDFPEIPDKLLNHFIRGVFDGDGTINLGKSNGRTKIIYSPEVNICSASLSFMERLKEILNKKLNFNYDISLNRQNNRKNEMYLYRIYGRINVLRFYNWIYQDDSFGMKRKKDKFLELKQRQNETGYRGVFPYKKDGLWRAQIKKDGKSYWLGRFESPEDAARAYDEKAKELFKEKAKLNFSQMD